MMATVAPLSASAPARFIAPPNPPPPLAYQEAECREPPIYDNVLHCDMTPFNYASLEQSGGFRVYISTLEKREMTEYGYRSVLADGDIQGSYPLQEAIRALRNGDGWEAACKGVGDTLAEADPHMEYVLAKLGVAALYEHRDRLWSEATIASLTCFAPPELACEIRKRKEQPDDWIPVCWYRLNEAQKKLVLGEARSRVDELKTKTALQSANVRKNKQEIREQLSFEMRQIMQEYEENRKNPKWLATTLKERYRVEGLDMDNLPPLAELQARLRDHEEQEDKVTRKAMLAPVPTDLEDPPIFAMDPLDTE